MSIRTSGSGSDESAAAQGQRKLTKGELEDARRAAGRLIEHWSTHQLHADWVYEQSREWLRFYGKDSRG